MKNTEQVVKTILQTTPTTKQITYDIIEGIDGRLSSRGTITPKQGVWLLNRIFRDDIHIPGDFITKIENGGTPEQQEAYAKIRTALQDGVMPTTETEKEEVVKVAANKQPLEIIDDLRTKIKEKNELNNSIQKVSGISPAARRGIAEAGIRIMIEDGIDLPKHIIDTYLQ
jgi:hypothetical protein